MSADGTIKKNITPDMTAEPDETDYIDAEAETVPDNVDPATGEIKTEQEQKDDAILAASMN